MNLYALNEHTKTLFLANSANTKNEYLEDLMNVKYPPPYGLLLLEVHVRYPPSCGLSLLEIDIKYSPPYGLTLLEVDIKYPPPCGLTLLEVDHSVSYTCCWK